MAETKNIITITNLLFFFKLVVVVIPNKVKRKIKVGNWNAKPKARANFKVIEIYSFIFGSIWIEKLSPLDDVSNATKKSHANGMIK